MSDSIDRGVPKPPQRKLNLVKKFRDAPEDLAAQPVSAAPVAEVTAAPAPEPVPAEVAAEPAEAAKAAAWPSFADADRPPAAAALPLPTPAAPAVAPAAVPEPPVFTQVEAPPVAPVPSRAPATAPVRITFDLPEDLRQRVRTVFKKTRNDEDDESFGDMMRKMVAAECQRRELLYNAGQRYTIDPRPLQSGRVII